MENYVVNENINNDFLSQSYCQGIERITGTKDSTFNFQIPEELVEIREKNWDNLFDKYSKETSDDDIELNVDTLEPEEEEEEKANNEEEYSCGQRVPMRKPPTLVQYWINTGNQPYKALLNENELSSLSLSEEESNPLLAPMVTNVVNAVNTIDASDKQKHRNDSSCSSVDTAAYILSNANVTKKADTIAIIEGAKCIAIKSLKDVSIKGTSSSDKIECMENTSIDYAIHNDHDNVNINVVSDTELFPMLGTESMALENNRMIGDILVSDNAIQSNIYSQSLSCEKTVDELNTSQRSSDVHNITSIFQFDKTSKQSIGNDNDISDRDTMLKMNSFHERQVSENTQCEIIAKDTSLTAFHRKKLYTGRDSPVDLILTETHGTNRLSGAKQSLHPALDPDGSIKRKTFLVHNGKSKRYFSKRNLGSKKFKRKEEEKPLCISKKTIIDISNKFTNNNDMIQNSNTLDSFKNSSDFHDNSAKRRDDTPFWECDDTNVPVRKEKRKPNLASPNLNPIVRLERIKPFFKRCKFKFGENAHVIAQKRSGHNDRRLNKYKKLYPCEIENLEVETVDSDESTILICQCNVNASQRASSLSDCSCDLRLNVEDNSALDAKKKDGQLSSSKDMSQNKEQIVEELSRSLTRDRYINATIESQVSNKNNAICQKVLSNKSKTDLYGKNEIDNMKLREIKIILERLPLSAKNCTSENALMKTQTLNKNDVIWEKEISDKTHFFNPDGANNIKLKEIRVVLERLPANVYLKEISNVMNTNILSDKKILNKKISQNTNLQTNHKRESPIRRSSKIFACEKGAAVRPVHNNYSLRINTKEHNVEIDDTFEIVTESEENQVFDEIESDSTFQQEIFRYENHSKVNKDNYCNSKYSVLTFSSDEDDFVRSIQHPRKRSKVSIDDKILGEPNIVEKNFCDRTKLVINGKNKDRFSKNSSTVIRPSEKTVQRDVGSIKEKRGCSGVEIKSFDNTQTTTDSLRIRKNERFVFFSSEDDNDSAADNSYKRKVRISVSKKDKINNNCKNRLNGVIRKNKIDHKDLPVMFQTNTFDTNSSDSEENTSSSIYRNRLRYHNRTNPKEIFNDSITKRYNERHLSSLNSSLEKYNRIRDATTRSRLIDKEAKANEQLTDEESKTSNIQSRINDMRKDFSSSSFINDARNPCKTQHVQEKMFSNIFREKTNLDRSLSKNKKISDKPKNSFILQSETYVTSTIRQSLTFQTKSYYDSSDSSETV